MNSVVSSFEEEAVSCLQRTNVGDEVIDSMRNNLKRHAHAGAVSEPLAFISPRYKPDESLTITL